MNGIEEALEAKTTQELHRILKRIKQELILGKMKIEKFSHTDLTWHDLQSCGPSTPSTHTSPKLEEPPKPRNPTNCKSMKPLKYPHNTWSRTCTTYPRPVISTDKGLLASMNRWVLWLHLQVDTHGHKDEESL